MVTLMLEQAVVLSVNLAGNLMLGSYSEAALSGVAAANQIQFVLQQLVFASSSGMVVLGSQYWGQHKPAPIRSLMALGIGCGLGISCIFLLGISLFPQTSARLFTRDEAIIAQGVSYLKIVRFSYPFYVLAGDQRLGFRLKHLLAFDRRLGRDYLRVTLPILLNSLVWRCNTALQMVILGRMDASAIAAHSISSTIFLFLKVTSVGAATAASILSGKAVGSGDMTKVESYTRTLQALFAAVGLAMALLLLLIRQLLLSLYILSPETRQLAEKFILF